MQDLVVAVMHIVGYISLEAHALHESTYMLGCVKYRCADTIEIFLWGKIVICVICLVQFFHVQHVVGDD